MWHAINDFGLWLYFFLWFGSDHGLWFSFRSSLSLSDVIQVNLTHRLKLRMTVQKFVSRNNGFLLRLLHHFLLLGLFRKQHLRLGLDCLVGAKLIDQSLILLVGNLGVRRSVVLDFTQRALLFKEINCRLKSYIQF